MAKTCTWNEHKKMGKKLRVCAYVNLPLNVWNKNNKAHWAMRCHFSLVV